MSTATSLRDAASALLKLSELPVAAQEHIDENSLDQIGALRDLAQAAAKALDPLFEAICDAAFLGHVKDYEKSIVSDALRADVAYPLLWHLNDLADEARKNAPAFDSQAQWGTLNHAQQGISRRRRSS